MAFDVSGGSNFIGAMATVANGNLQQSQFQQAGSNVTALSQYNTTGSPEDKKQALQQFEGLFVGQLLRLMFETVDVDKNFGGGLAEETYRGLMVDEYGMNISKTGGIGIAQRLQRSLVDFQNIDSDVTKTFVPVNAAVSAYQKIYNFK